jgi:hypothetical protein
LPWAIQVSSNPHTGDVDVLTADSLQELRARAAQGEQLQGSVYKGSGRKVSSCRVQCTGVQGAR